MRSGRTLLALLCVAIIALAVVVPVDAAGDVLAFLMPVWLEFQPDLVVVAFFDSTPSPEQPVSRRALAAFRGPPAVLPA
jgi:hypothetical protein